MMQVVRKYYAAPIRPNALSLARGEMPMTKPSQRSFTVACVLSGAALALCGAFGSLGCSSSKSGTGATGPSGELIGPPDSHCAAPDGTLMIQTIGVCGVIDPARVPSNSSTCGVIFTADAGAAPPASDPDASTNGYGPTMYGSAGNDDDCKYYLSWIATPIQEKADTYFTVTVLRLQDMQPATCAGIGADLSLDPVDDAAFSTHGVAAPANPAPEIMPGVYQVGPIRFDAPGTWTVRFHLFEECTDTPASPHGHAAFFVKVP
jgi:hypothetical protein